MSYDGAGLFSRIYSWATDRDGGVKITASRMDTEMDGFATGLSTCILKDGTQTVTANIPMNSKKFTGLAAGSAAGDSVRYEQVVLLSAGAAQTVTSAAAGVIFTIESTEAGAGVGPVLSLYRNSASPADGDLGPALYFYGKDSGGTQTLYASIDSTFTDITDATEDSKVRIATFVAGSFDNRLVIEAGVYTAGTDPGSGNMGATTFVAGTSIELGHATQNTLTASGGDLSIEGNRIFRVGGADVPVADGGTGASTAAAAYANLGPSTIASFRAHKNSSTQTISSTAETTVTFGTEAFDVGSKFASNTWTPPAGTVSISARLLIENVGSGVTYARIKKGAAVLSAYVLLDTPSGHNVMLTAIDQCSGSDTYTVTVENTADSSYTVQGSAENTYFCGSMV